MSIVIYHFTIANEINTNHAIINAIINLLWEKNTIVPRFVLAVVQCCYHLKTVEENGIFSFFFNFFFFLLIIPHCVLFTKWLPLWIWKWGFPPKLNNPNHNTTLTPTLSAEPNLFVQEYVGTSSLKETIGRYRSLCHDWLCTILDMNKLSENKPQMECPLHGVKSNCDQADLQVWNCVVSNFLWRSLGQYSSTAWSSLCSAAQHKNNK